MKKCRLCGEAKPFSEFYRQTGMRDGHRNECKSCHTIQARERYRRDPSAAIRRTQEWRERNPNRYAAWLRRNRTENKERRAFVNRNGHLRRKYGLSQDDYEFLVKAQGNRCCICEEEDELGLHVDHDHNTRLVRGLLCGKCNRAIGLLEENPKRFRAAEQYLLRTQLMLGCGDRVKVHK